jgi:hypothetical protein
MKTWTFEEIEAVGERMKANSKRLIEHNKIVRFEAPDLTLWRAKAIVDLYEWMQASNDYRKTVDLWAAVYIKCGTCHRGFLAWFDECEVGPKDDLLEWLKAAQEIVTEKRWI